jgi:hypothetical protein
MKMRTKKENKNEKWKMENKIDQNILSNVRPRLVT